MRKRLNDTRTIMDNTGQSLDDMRTKKALTIRVIELTIRVRTLTRYAISLDITRTRHYLVYNVVSCLDHSTYLDQKEL